MQKAQAFPINAHWSNGCTTRAYLKIDESFSITSFKLQLILSVLKFYDTLKSTQPVLKIDKTFLSSLDLCE